LKYLGGFTSYNKVVLLNSFIFTINPNLDTMSIDRESLLLSVRIFVSNLEDSRKDFKRKLLKFLLLLSWI
jgi:hypothetical protein